MSSRLITTAILAMLFAACSGENGDPCATNSDCFAGEVCRADGYCGAPEPDDDAGSTNGGTQTNGTTQGDVGGRNNQSSNNQTANNQTANNHTMNNSAVDAGIDDMSAQPDQGATGPCIVDPFVQCEDDENSDNNDFPGEQVVPETKGCQSTGFEPLDVTIQGKMCALDPEDLYRFNIVECDDSEPGFVIEATLDVKQDCDPELIHFDVEGIGTTCAEPDPEDDQTIRCETLPDGRRKISIIWPGSAVPVVGGIRFSIQTPDRDDVEFEYDLHLVLREP